MRKEGNPGKERERLRRPRRLHQLAKLPALKHPNPLPKNQKRKQQKNNDYNLKFETGIGPTTDRILNSILDRLTTDNFKEKLTDKIVYPITHLINKKLKPYVYVSMTLYLILVVLLVFIIYLLLKNKS